MNKYSTSKVINAMEIEIKERFKEIVITSLGVSVENLKSNIKDTIFRDNEIKTIIEKYLEE